MMFQFSAVIVLRIGLSSFKEIVMQNDYESSLLDAFVLSRWLVGSK